MFNPIARYRAQACAAQHGRCFYCHVEMCTGDPEPFAQSHGISIAQARLLKCTAEHLIARKDGGRNTRENIVAACFTCNNRRHRRKQPLPPELHRARVQHAIARRRWHGDWLFRCTALLGHALA
jgi:5-methylcytosine-specific restriction endonuclease McrA